MLITEDLKEICRKENSQNIPKMVQIMQIAIVYYGKRSLGMVTNFDLKNSVN